MPTSCVKYNIEDDSSFLWYGVLCYAMSISDDDDVQMKKTTNPSLKLKMLQ